MNFEEDGNHVQIPDPIGYITMVNPKGVRLVLKRNGYDPAEGYAMLYGQVQKLIVERPSVKSEIYAQHPDMDMVLSSVGAPKNSNFCSSHNSNYCGCGSSNYTGHDPSGLEIDPNLVGTYKKIYCSLTQRELELALAEVTNLLAMAHFSQRPVEIEAKKTAIEECLTAKGKPVVIVHAPGEYNIKPDITTSIKNMASNGFVIVGAIAVIGFLIYKSAE